MLSRVCLHVITCCLLSLPADSGDTGPTSRFGDGKKVGNVDQIQGFPSPFNFFVNNVLPSKPLQMTSAAKLSPAFKLWTDTYFLNLDIPLSLDETVVVETRKKENRTKIPDHLHFKDFVETYNSSDIYMVNAVPKFLMQDVLLPGPLHCQQVWEQILVENVMWYSSGGTKSVIHTDAVDNIICLYRGEKKFVLVDPHKYGSKVEIDHPEGAYSSIDVDNVDYEKYPDLLDVEYFHASLQAGDCLYIPYKWIHQVRSYHSNIAVNVWWDFHKNKDVDLSRCQDKPDLTLTLDKVNFKSFQVMMDSPTAVKDQYIDFCTRLKTDMNFEALLDIYTGDTEDEILDAGEGYAYPLKKIFRILDASRNGIITEDEIQAASGEDWMEVHTLQKQFDEILHALYETYDELHGGVEHEGEGGEEEDSDQENRPKANTKTQKEEL